MVAIGRALMANPRVLLCDELSLGLAPVVIRDIYAAFPRIRAAGASLVIVEQDIGQALKVADRVYCMMEGRITLSGAPAELSREDIHAAYFGVCGMNWLDTIVQGILLGGLYALFAAGLSLVFGIMRLVNLAHGDLIVLAAYLILVIVSALGISPFLALLHRRPDHVRDRLGAAVRRPQPHAWRGHPAAAAGHLRAVDRHPERAARGVLRRQPADRRGRARDRLRVRSARSMSG